MKNRCTSMIPVMKPIILIIYLCRMILVTGGTGLVGSHLLYELALKGAEIKAIRRKNSNPEKVFKTFEGYGKNAGQLYQRINWVEGDVLDIFSIEDAMKGVTDVYHCAGMVSFYGKDKAELFRTNANGTANVVDVALNSGIRKLCHVSSISALGKSRQGETLTENHFWKTSKNNSPYAISKYAAEREIWRGAEEGLDVVIVNPAIILGPGDWNNGSSKLFSTVWRGMFYYTNGVNGYVDVRDVVRIMIQLMETDIKSQRFILSAEDVTYQQIIGMIARSIKKEQPFFKLYPWMGEIGWRMEKLKFLIGKRPTFSKQIAESAFHKFYYSNQKIAKALNYEFIPIEKSIEDTARFFLEDLKEKLGK